MGAPVIAVASGVIAAAGPNGGAGRMVRIRHASGYESSYLHLSAIAAGIRSGAHVGQGEMIGRVGATGLATGPHLDYRLAKNGRFVNPLLQHRSMPPGEPIPADHLEAFSAVRDAALAQLNLPVAAAPGQVRSPTSGRQGRSSAPVQTWRGTAGMRHSTAGARSTADRRPAPLTGN